MVENTSTMVYDTMVTFYHGKTHGKITPYPGISHHCTVYYGLPVHGTVYYDLT